MNVAGNEIGEKLAVVGFQTNMITYLTQQLHIPLTKAANILTNFNGTGSLTPLLGAFLADSYVGKFWVITLATIIYQIVRLPFFFYYVLYLCWFICQVDLQFNFFIALISFKFFLSIKNK